MELGRAAVFFDFDGTITPVDTGVHVMEALADPRWRELDRRYAAGEIGSRECVGQQWDLLERSEQRVRAVTAEVPVDPDFEPLVRSLWEAGAEVAIVSDGFGFYAQEIADRVGVDCYANRVNWSEWRLEYPFEDRCCACSSCGTCKQAPIKDAKRRKRTTVLVGDGTSDRKAAVLADVLFAKDALAGWCDEAGVRYRCFRSLGDVAEVLFAGSEERSS